MSTPSSASEGPAAAASARELLSFVKEMHNLKTDDEAILKLAFEAGYRHGPSGAASGWSKADSVARYEHLIRQQHSLIVKLRQQIVELQTLQQSNPMLQIGTGHAFLSNSAPPAVLINNGPPLAPPSSKRELKPEQVAQSIAAKLPMKPTQSIQTLPVQSLDKSPQQPPGPMALTSAVSGVAIDKVTSSEDTTRPHAKRDFDLLLNDDSAVATSAPKRPKLAESAAIPSIETPIAQIHQPIYSAPSQRTSAAPPLQLPTIGSVFSPLPIGPNQQPLAAAVAAPPLALPLFRSYPPGPPPAMTYATPGAAVSPLPSSRAEIIPQMAPLRFDPSMYQIGTSQSVVQQQRAQSNRSPLTMTTMSAPQLTASATVMAETIFGQQIIDLSTPVTSPSPNQ